MPEPSAKRKTLADRAGEPYQPRHAPHPSDQLPNGAVAATVQAGPRNTSFSSSTSSRLPSAHSRTTSASSYGRSVGSTTRPRSQYGQARPGTAMGHSRTNSYHAGTATRPATSQAQYPVEKAPPVEQGPTGIVTTFIATPKNEPSIPVAKQRHRTPCEQNTPRISSFVGKKHSQQRFSTPSPPPCPVKSIRDLSISTALDRMHLHQGSVKLGRQERKSEDKSHKTPSHIPRLIQTPNASFSASQQQDVNNALDGPFFCRPPSPPKSPTKSQSRPGSPNKQIFLTKSSNLTAHIEVDANCTPWSGQDFFNKLDGMEQMFEHFKAQMVGTNFERNQYKDMIDLMKNRSRKPTVVLLSIIC